MLNYLNGKLFFLLVVTSILSWSAQTAAVIVLVETPLGDFQIELFDNETPITTANFLSYIEDDSYVNSFVHRSSTGFVIQGGSYTSTDNVLSNIPQKPPIINEFNRSNTRGTIAMANRAHAPTSAPNSWFINIDDNIDLDTQNGGFTVFGQVIGNGMDVVDAIHALPPWDASVTSGGDFTEIPLIDYLGSGNILRRHLVFTEFSIPEDLKDFSDLQVTKTVDL